jgi:hypothetical protein
MNRRILDTVCSGVCVDINIQKDTTLIFLDPQLVHHFNEGTSIDTTDINATAFQTFCLNLFQY